jgi:hypothetical protein
MPYINESAIVAPKVGSKPETIEITEHAANSIAEKQKKLHSLI